MTPEADPPTRLDLTLTYSDEELAEHQGFEGRDSRLFHELFPWAVWLMYAIAAATALAAAFLSVWWQVVSRLDGEIVVILAAAAFWIGLWTPAAVRSLHARRWRRHFYQRRNPGLTRLTVTPLGLRIVRTKSRAFYRRSAVHSVKVYKSLLIVWLQPESPLVIPRRLLTAPQQDYLLAYPAKPTLDGPS